MSLARLETGKSYTEKVNTWKWEGYVRFTFTKMVIANTGKFRCFTMKDGSDCATCTTFPRQIGPVDDNPTIAYTLGAHVRCR